MQTDTERKICANANREQRRVIMESDKNVLLVASAGTGKTDTLARRIAYLLAMAKACKEEILCLTFTNKACREMKERIRTFVGQEAQHIDVLTVHSFCYKLLTEENKRSSESYRENYIFDEDDSVELSNDLRPRGMSSYNFQQWLSLVKMQRSLYGYYSGDDLADYEKTLQRLYKEEQTTVQKLFQERKVFHADICLAMMQSGAKIVDTYNRRLRELSGYDFSDLITGAHQLLQDEDVRERWRQRYKYICVDEMQDTGELEYEVMKSMWPGNHILLCGDYFQTIYEWRGSNPTKMLADFRKIFQPETIIFYENYRSNRRLFETAFKTLANMFPEDVRAVYERMPQAHATEMGAPLVVHEAMTMEDEARYVWQEIDALSKEEAANVGILVRNNRQAQQLSQSFQLLNERSPKEETKHYMLIDDTKFFRRQEIKDSLAFIKLVLNPYDRSSAKRIMSRFVTGIGESRVKELDSTAVRETGLRLSDFLNAGIFTAEPYEQLAISLAKEEVIVFDVESTGIDTLTDEIIQIAALRIDETGKAVEKFERFIRPSKSVGDSEAVHGFSDAWLAEHGEEAATVLRDFQKFTEGATIVGHNVNYDVSIFTTELLRYNLPSPRFCAVYDTLDLYRRFYPKLANHKLGFLSEQFATNHKPSHNAMDDILATAELLVYIMQEKVMPAKDERRRYIMQYKSYFANYAVSFDTFKRIALTDGAKEALTYMVKHLGVGDFYAKKADGQKRMDHIRALYLMFSSVEREEELAPQAQLRQIVQISALTAGEADPRLHHRQAIPIITVHQAKGSEFSRVYLMGMTEGMFPSWSAIVDGSLDEEKRLFYVALTRAKEKLVLTHSRRSLEGRELKPSSLLSYLPTEEIYRD